MIIGLYVKSLENNLIKTNSNSSRGERKPPRKNKFDFKNCHENTIKSLHEVEYFLNNLHDLSRYLRLYKLLK